MAEFSKKWNDFKSYVKYLYRYELLTYSPIVFFLFIVLVCLGILFLVDRNDGDFNWHDIIVEAHGLIFDLLVFGLVFAIFEHFRSKKERILRYKEEIEDFVGWKSEEAKYKINGNIRRLSELGVRQFFLSNCYLRESNLSDFDMSNSVIAISDLEGSGFMRSTLTNVKFIASNLKEVYFTKSYLENADLSDSDCRNAYFTVAELMGCNFSNADLRGASFIACNFEFANMTNVKLENAIVDDLNWIEDLHNQNVIGADKIALSYYVDEKTKDESDGYPKYKIRKRKRAQIQCDILANIKRQRSTPYKKPLQ